MKQNQIVWQILLLGGIVSQEVHAQGYYINRYVPLADTTITQPLTRLAVSDAIVDVRASGMGRTRVADENSLSSFCFNPGFLGRTDKVAGIGSLVATAPVQTIDAIVFVSKNSPELGNAYSLRALQDAVQAYRDGVGIKPAVEEKLAKVAAYAQDLFKTVVGDPNNPDVHGANFDVNALMQIGHWGFSLHGYGQTGMAVYPGSILKGLLDVYLRTDFRDSTQSSEALADLEALLHQLVNPVTGQVTPGALPGFYSLTYADIIATAGYGFMLADSLSVGADVKVINRRFAAARISSADASDIAQQLFGNLKTSVTGVTFDIGAVYRTPFGLTIGMTIQNLIPLKVVSSQYSLEFNSVRLQRDRDANGDVIVNAEGDTALASYSQKTTLNGPASLALPCVANVGVLFPIHEDWDASFELADIAAQVTSYKNYAQRFGFGMEYRLHFFGGNFHVAPRVGFANVEPSLGLGLSYRDVIMLNAAYFTSTIVQARKNIAVQLSVAW